MVREKKKKGEKEGEGVLHETLLAYKLACIFHMPQNAVEI
jgi:hypothetical protein